VLNINDDQILDAATAGL